MIGVSSLGFEEFCSTFMMPHLAAIAVLKLKRVEGLVKNPLRGGAAPAPCFLPLRSDQSNK